MKTYRVTWCIDIEAETPEDAARQALEIQHDPESVATVFDVEGKHYDFCEHPECQRDGGGVRLLCRFAGLIRQEGKVE